MSMQLSIKAAPHRRPRSAFSRVEEIQLANGGRLACEFFDDTTEGRAALMLVAVQLGPRAVAGVKEMLTLADRAKRLSQG